MPGPLTPSMLRRDATVRSIDAEKRTVEFVASTAAEDAHGTILEQDWEERLGRFRANPVILWAHDCDDMPIGRAAAVGVVDGELRITVEFAGAEISEQAERVFRAVVGGFVRGMSVGFWPHGYRWEERAGREVLVLYQLELMEASVVPVPSNPEALARSMSAATLAEKFPRVARAAPNPTPEVTPMTEEEKKRLAALEALMRSMDVSTPEELDAALSAQKRDAARARELEAERATAAKTAETTERAALLAGAKRDGRISKADADDADYQRELAGYSLPQLRAHLSRLTPRAGAAAPATPARTLPTKAAVTARAADERVAKVLGLDVAKLTKLRAAKHEEARAEREEPQDPDTADDADGEDNDPAGEPADTED